MVELAATLFVIIVLSNFVIGFVNGIGGWENAALAIVFLIVGIVLVTLFGIGIVTNGLGDTVFGVVVFTTLMYLIYLVSLRRPRASGS